MLGQIWNSLTRKPATNAIVAAQLDPIVKYRLALYLTTTTAQPASQAPNGAAYFRKVTAGLP